MLSNEVMGVFALAVVWLNTGLIAASALMAAVSIGRLASAFESARGRGELVRARVTRGDGEGGAIAERRVHQVGRAVTKSGPDRILFTDRQSEMRITGGEIEVDGQALTLAAADGEVWITGASGRREPPAFEAAWSRAGTNKGVESLLVMPLGAGEVWIRGKREGSAMRADLIAARCPIVVLSTARRRLVAFSVGAVVVLAGITVVCLTPPVFGTVSTLGGALMLGFFILIQPLAVMVRNATRPPPDQLVGGVWRRPSS